ncbi:17934_t:CDS:2, partial [Racocetra fulgida]
MMCTVSIGYAQLKYRFKKLTTESHEDSESSSTLRSPRREKQERTKTRKVSERSPSQEGGRLNKKKSGDLKNDESKDLSEVGSLKLENTRLMTRIAELEQIVKEKNVLETELKQIIEENAEKAKLRDAELNARIMELERSAKENEERFVKLEQKQNNTVDRLENGDNSYENDNIPDLVIKSLEDDTPSSNITDDALSSDVYQESQDLSSSEQSNSLYNINTVMEMNPKDSTEVSKEETKSQDCDSSNLNIPEISSEPKSPTNQKIPYNQKVERGLRLELFTCTKDNNHKVNKVFDIQIPEFSLEAILTGS